MFAISTSSITQASCVTLPGITPLSFRLQPPPLSLDFELNDP